ncbi:uncharacterized protein LOC131323543 isoform X2 [Rhododendron vialii]|uniref:uncharacterized protein LOC131323543 isoform X2 n=1 Tax=Rhododendron vialii TaxID=182163 RepID=UPI00265DA86F|nr:uncharacterized protein LOC131323543 isoform X2 [Rhododendron vialii]
MDEVADEYFKEVSRFTFGDDRRNFMKLMKGTSQYLMPEVMVSICGYNAVKCASALLKGETGLIVDLNVPLKEGRYPLHLMAECMSYRMINLFLRHGAQADVKTKDSDTLKGGFLPLNVSLEMLGYHEYLVDWTPKDSIFKLIMLLCLPKMKIPLEVNKLLARKTKRVDDVFYYYALEGKLIEMTALLMVARKRVMAGFEGSMDIRQHLFDEMTWITHDETRLMGHGNGGKSVRGFKDKKEVIMSAFVLLEVFEKAGDRIEAYVRSVQSKMTEQEVIKDIMCLLNEAGIIVKDNDIDLSNIDCETDKIKLETQELENKRRQLHDLGMPVQSLSGSFCAKKNPVTTYKNEHAQSTLRFFKPGSPLLQPGVRYYFSVLGIFDLEEKKTTTKNSIPYLLSMKTYSRFALLIKKGIRRI